MIKFNFSICEEALVELEAEEQIDSIYAIKDFYSELFYKNNIPIENYTISGNEFDFDINKNINDETARKIASLLKERDFKIIAEEGDDWYSIRAGGQPGWNDVLMVNYSYDKGVEVKGETIPVVLLICCDDVNNAVRLVANL